MMHGFGRIEDKIKASFSSLVSSWSFWRPNDCFLTATWLPLLRMPL